MGKFKDLSGKKFGRLTVIRQNGFTNPNKYGQRHAIWYCKCDCGNYVERTTDVLKRGKSSCGCRKKEVLISMSRKNITHNMTHTRLYRIYKGMISRCYYKSSQRYNSYGGRGIIVCDEWKNDRTNFFDWAMNNGYRDDLTIDRIDVNGNYEPSNCRWVDIIVQSRNRRDCVYIEYRGEKRTVAEWSEITGIKDSTIRNRLNRGWEVDKALSVKSRKYRKKNSL